MGLRGVLDDDEAVPLRDLDERRHVGHEAVQVDRHDRLGPGRDRRLDLRRVHAEVVLADVHEHGRGPGSQDHADRRIEAERDRDDLVARADAQRVQHGLWATVPLP